MKDESEASEALDAAVFSPIHGRFELIETDDVRSLLDAVEPRALIEATREGRDAGLALLPADRRQTRRALRRWADEAIRAAGELSDAWHVADRLERGQLVDGFLAGFRSEEAAAGAALGSLFGPLGTTLGGLIGGALAGNEKDEERRRAITQYALAVDAWYDAAIHDFENSITEACSQDQQERANAATVTKSDALLTLGCLAAVALLLGGAAYGVYAGYEWITQPDDVTVRAEPVPPPPRVDARHDDLSGEWAADDGSRFIVRREGSTVALVAVGSDQHERTEFVLWPDQPGTFTVHHTVLIHPEDGSAVDQAAESSCQRVFTKVEGTDLRARRVGPDELNVEQAVVELTLRNFTRRRGRVVACKGVGSAVAHRSEIVLRRTSD